MTRLNPFVVLTGSAFSYKVVGDTPTPALIDASNDGKPHEAYQHPVTGFWRLRDEKYDPPGTAYTSVYVAHLPECRGFPDIPMPHLVEWGTKLTDGQCDDHREVLCPGAMTVPGWNAHKVPASEELFGEVHRRCYDCATADGIPTGDELAAGVES
jgi:hypothetical protein